MMIQANWKYLMYVLKHKWYVWLACLRLGDPFLILWRGIIHDWQKFTPAEWRPYVLSFYGPWGYKNRPDWLVDAFDQAWLHHQHHGPHHWQHWILRKDDGDIKALSMPRRYVLEMVADWHGAGRAINGKADLHDWYVANREKIVLHPNTREMVEYLVFQMTIERRENLRR